MLHTSANQNFVKVTKIFLDSLDRESGNVSKYRVRLPFHISNVVGASLRAYSFPGNIFTSFSRSVNDSLDFTLVRDDDYQASFTVTWEPKVYEYSNGNLVDYCFTLQTMLHNAVADHPVFGSTGTNPVDFEVLPSPEKKTFIRVSGAGLIEVIILADTRASIPQAPVRTSSNNNRNATGTYANADGVSMSPGDRTLLFGQNNAVENGVYIVLPDMSKERASDFALGTSVSKFTVLVTEGTNRANKTYICTNKPGEDVVGTHELTFVEYLPYTRRSLHRSAASIMGFDAFDLKFTLLLNGVVQVKSPNPVNLNPPKSIDLFIEEFSKDTFGRFYLDSEDRVQIDNTLSRVSLLEIPIRTLKELSIRLEVLGQPIETLRENEHNLSLTVFSLNEEINVPAWVSQNFSN
jgi:hypothetical protein